MVTVSHRPHTVYTGEVFTLTCTIVVGPVVDTNVMVTATWTGPQGTPTSSNPTLVSAGTYKSTLRLNLDTAGPRDYTCNAAVSPHRTPLVRSNSGVGSKTITIRK